MATRLVSRSADRLSFRKRSFVLEALEERALLSGDGFFRQANLVANEPGVARIHDPALVNAWGVSLSRASGPFWVSASATGVSTLYMGDVNGSAFVKSGLTVTVPGGTPTGQVFNGTPDFVVSSGTSSGPALFIFASTTGHITGWNPAVPLPPPSRVAQLAVTTPGQSQWTGLAIASNAAGNFLYAADFRNRTIDVFDRTFQPVTLAGNFVDPHLPRSYSPFNIQALGGKLYVTYAHQSHRGDGLPRGGSGFVSVFDTEGRFLDRLVSGNRLDQPWGLALAPSGFGEFGGALLVGNHGNGRINAFDPNTGRFLGGLENERGRAIRIDGLWGLAFGNGISAGDDEALYFTAGPDNGADGLFGSLRFVAEPPEDQGRSFPGLVGFLTTLRGTVAVGSETSGSTERPDLIFNDIGTLLYREYRGERNVPGLLATTSHAGSPAEVIDLVFGLPTALFGE